MLLSSGYGRAVGSALAACFAFAALTVALPERAAVIDCEAPAKRLIEVTSVRSTTCLAARQDIDSFVDAFAPTFKTPGGYTCTRTLQHESQDPIESSWRCVMANRAYRFSRGGITRPGVRATGPGYDKTFTVTKCTHKGETDLVLNGTGVGGYRLVVNAANGTATFSLNGGDEQDSISARGTISSVRVGKAGNIAAVGRFTSGLKGTLELTRDCD